MSAVGSNAGDGPFERADSIASEGNHHASSVASSEEASDYFARFTTAPASVTGVPRSHRSGAGLGEFREKHAKCIEVLRKKASRAGSSNALQAPQQGAQPVQGEVRQQGLPNVASSSSIASSTATANTLGAASGVAAQPPAMVPEYGSVPPSPAVPPSPHSGVVGAPVPDGVSASTVAAPPQPVEEDPILKALRELKEQQATLLLEAGERQGSAAEQLMAGVSDLLQETAQELRVLRSGLEAQGRDLAALRAQEAHVSLRALRESLDTCDKMSALRAQETQLALDKLREALASQGKDMETRARDAHAAVSAMREGLEAQGQEIRELRPKVQEAQSGFVAVRQSIEDCSGKLGAFTTQAGRHHQEQLEELEQLRRALSVQSRCDSLRTELEDYRRREAAHEAAASTWREERSRLQGEVLQLTRLAELSQQGGGGGASGEVSAATLAALHRPPSGLFETAASHPQARPMALLAIGVAVVGVVTALGSALRAPPPAPPPRMGLMGLLGNAFVAAPPGKPVAFGRGGAVARRRARSLAPPPRRRQLQQLPHQQAEEESGE